MDINVDATPLGWQVNLLFYFAHAATILAEDIDGQLKTAYGRNCGLEHEKKKYLQNYNNCISQAREKLRQASKWMEKLDPDAITFECADNSSKRYTNVLAFANEFIRFNMLYMDRSQTAESSARLFKMLRLLPEGGVFPESFLERFKIGFELVPEKGDRVKNANHGEGTLDFCTGNGNWNVRFDNGDTVILHENQFKIL